MYLLESWAHVSKENFHLSIFMLCILMNNKDWFDLIIYLIWSAWAHVSKENFHLSIFMLCILMNNKDWFDLIIYLIWFDFVSWQRELPHEFAGFVLSSYIAFFWTFPVSGSCFRTLAVILVSDFVVVIFLHFHQMFAFVLLTAAFSTLLQHSGTISVTHQTFSVSYFLWIIT